MGEARAGLIDENLFNPILPSSSPSEWPSQRPLVFCAQGEDPQERILTARQSEIPEAAAAELPLV
jgi:hypothetical protein